jgi:hypothetical protein
MEERYTGPIVPGQDLCDISGKKVGRVARVYREDVSITGRARPEHEEVMEVKTGLFGLGERLYVPVGAVDDAIEDAVFVHKLRQEFEDEWRHRPDYLDS